MRIIGIDPGSKSWDFYGLDNSDIILDTAVPTKDLMREPIKFITIINAIRKEKEIDLMVAPSGFGLPLKRVRELTEEDIFYTLLKFEEEKSEKLLGLGSVLRLIKKENIPGIIVPGVKHLPTIPRYRKVNKIDMGTADKLCTSVVGIKDQMERFQVAPEDTSFIMVEIGYGFTAVLAIENGKIIDGIGGSNIMGFRACGSLDGELAYLIHKINKKNIYRGGVAYISGYSDLSLKEITLLAKKDDKTKTALQAYISSVQKAVYGISSSFSDGNNIKEVLLAGRGSEIFDLRKMVVSSLKDVASVRLMANYSHIAKRAAQGAAFIADGLLGGQFKSIIDNMEIKNARGGILDDIYIPFKNKKIPRD
jgi:predicted butyrate kinase (DUF1464 family)